MSQQLQPYATVRLRYIGLKDRRRDNVIPDSGLVWNGYGDEQDVAAVHAQKYLVHADVWERASVPLRPRPQLQTPQAIGSVVAAVPVYTGDTSVAGIVFPVEVVVAMVLANAGGELTIEQWNRSNPNDRSEAVAEMLQQMRDAANEWGRKTFSTRVKRKEDQDAQDAGDDGKQPQLARQPAAEAPRPPRATAAPKAEVPNKAEAPKAQAPSMHLE